MKLHRGVFPPPDMGDPEDHGEYCVWWYGRTRRGFRVVEWAYALAYIIGTQKVWRVSSSVSGFKTRETAIAAGASATRSS